MALHPILGWGYAADHTPTGIVHRRYPIVYPGEAHLLTVAPPGSGKSRSVVIPNLLRYEGSMVVADFKGELARATALWRSVMLGQNVIIFDPYKLVEDRFLPETDGVGNAR